MVVMRENHGALASWFSGITNGLEEEAGPANSPQARLLPHI